VYVATPVAGPGLCARYITNGTFAIPAKLKDSVIKSKPPPEVPTIAFAPVIALPIPALTTEISFSNSKTK